MERAERTMRVEAGTGIDCRSSGLRRARSGFMLPLVFGTMALLTLFFVSMSFLSSGQTQTASHVLDSARSLSIAKAGAEWAITSYASGTYLDNPLSDKKINPLHEALFGTSVKEGEFPLEYPNELREYVENELHGKLEVTAKLCDVVPLLLPNNLDGFKQDPIEKTGTIEFSAVGTVKKASRRVCIRKGFKLVMMVHPVLSKFTLFLREKPAGQDVNSLERRTASFGYENGCSPIILNNQGYKPTGESNAFGVVTPSTQAFDLSIVTKDGFAELVRKSGWVFLNSGAEPWNLNLSGGGDYGEYDDRLLLRVGLYRNRVLEDSLTKTLPTGETIEQLRERFQGMKTDYECRSPQGDIQKKPSKILYMRYLFPNDPPKSSLLRPFGTGTRFSPTLVFGPVSMWFMRFRGIDVTFLHAGATGKKTFTNVLIPGFLNEADFAQAYRPRTPEDADMVQFARILEIKDRNNPGPYFGKYATLMSEIASRPYLDALDYIFLAERESGTLLQPQASEKKYDEPPPHIIGDTPSSDTRPWLGNRSTLIGACGTFGMDTVTLYEGKLSDIFGCKEFQAKVTAVFRSFTELESAFRDGTSPRLRLPGIVYIGKDDLTIDREVEFTSPGILICGGSVILKAAVKSRHPVTIVSLKDITVETGSPIEAHLICLKGTFRAKNGFDIRGGLAARTMDFSTMKLNEKSISFAPEHDPYGNPVKWQEKAAYRYYLSQEEECFVEGGKK